MHVTRIVNIGRGKLAGIIFGQNQHALALEIMYKLFILMVLELLSI